MIGRDCVSKHYLLTKIENGRLLLSLWVGAKGVSEGVVLVCVCV